MDLRILYPWTETGEKWLHRRAKIFFASAMFLLYQNERQAVNCKTVKAKNIWFAACEPFFTGFAKLPNDDLKLEKPMLMRHLETGRVLDKEGKTDES